MEQRFHFFQEISQQKTTSERYKSSQEGPFVKGGPRTTISLTMIISCIPVFAVMKMVLFCNIEP